MTGDGVGRGLRAVLLLAVIGAAAPGAGQAQSAVDRTPNLDGTWVPDPGRLHFHLLHRFRVLDPPSRKVVNSPTFLLATGLPGGPLGVGLRYASSSLLVPGEPNELEVFGRWSPWREEAGHVLGATVQVGYNANAGSLDGELALARSAGPVRLLGALRGFSALGEAEARVAVAAGAGWRLSRNVALAADVATVPGFDDADAAWGLGLQLGIPTTPHSLSLHLSNVNATTLQGASLGDGESRWGFEFTIPVTLSRYLGGGGGDAAAPRGPPDDPPPGADRAVGAVVEMDDRLRFLPDTIRIEAGEVVEWRNPSRLVHTVTADPDRALDPSRIAVPDGAERFHSGDLAPGAVFRRAFPVPGTYRYICVPHEAADMVGVVVVEGAGSAEDPA